MSQMAADQVVGLRMEPRICEQQFGNYQDVDAMACAKRERRRFGQFFYRFPNGEAGMDVYTRVTSFVATLFRDVEQMAGAGIETSEMTICIVTHGAFHVGVCCVVGDLSGPQVSHFVCCSCAGSNTRLLSLNCPAILAIVR